MVYQKPRNVEECIGKVQGYFVQLMVDSASVRAYEELYQCTKDSLRAMRESTWRTNKFGGREIELLARDGSKITLGHRGLTLREWVYAGYEAAVETGGNIEGVIFEKSRITGVMSIRYHVIEQTQRRPILRKKMNIDEWKPSEPDIRGKL